MTATALFFALTVLAVSIVEAGLVLRETFRTGRSA